MTLTVDTEPHASNTPTTTSPQGQDQEKAAEAQVVPVDLTCYQVLTGSDVRGYVCVDGTAWECFVGPHRETASSIGLRESLADAIRAVVAEGS